MRVLIPPGMTIQWKPHIRQRRDGSTYLYEAGVMNREGARHYFEILAMPSGIPISFLEAKRLEHLEFQKLLEGKRYGELGELALHWVDWISRQGFHVVLTGEEFEVVPESVSEPIPGPTTVSLTLTVAGQTLRLLTFKNRPPIEQVRIRREGLIEIHYTTGESEEARVQCREYPDSFRLMSLWDEYWQGHAPAVQPYTWAA